MTPAQSRRALGLSVNEFAAALGVNPVTVRRWEMDPAKRSFRDPGAATYRAIEMMLERHDSRHITCGLQSATPAKPLTINS